MTLGEFLLDEKTKVSLNIINFVILVGFAVTASFTFATWKTEAESTISALELRVVNEEIVREESDMEIEQEQKEQRVQMAEIQTGQGEIKEGMARIETNILWIMNDLKDKE